MKFPMLGASCVALDLTTAPAVLSDTLSAGYILETTFTTVPNTSDVVALDLWCADYRGIAASNSRFLRWEYAVGFVRQFYSGARLAKRPGA